MRLPRLSALVSIAFVLLVASANAQPSPVIRIALNAGDAYAEAYYAQELGFFQKAGLRVEIQGFSSGIAIATAVASGAADVGVSNVAYLAKQNASGTPFVFLAGDGMYTSQAPIIALCAGRNSTLRRPRDLQDRNVAITRLGDQSEVATKAWMDQAGADPRRVHFIEVPFAEMQVALDHGLADAANITEPWLSVALKSGTVKIIGKPYDAIGSRFYIGVWFTTSPWYAKNAALAKRFVSVIYETARYANGHRDRTAEILSQLTKIDPETVRSMTRTPFSTDLDASIVQHQLDMAYRYRILDRPMNAASLIAK